MDRPQYWDELLTLVGYFRKGFLPDEGAITTQANRGIQLIAQLDGIYAEAEAQKTREDMQKGRE